MWGVFLSEPLDIVAMVGRCPAIKLMSREPIRYRRTFQLKAMQPLVVWDISRRFHRLSPCIGQVAHVLRTLPPVAAGVLLPRAAPRLACVKPAASVHPEPGSNSSLYISISQVQSGTSNFQEINALDFFVFGTCFLVLSLSVFSMNYRCFSNGLQRYALFLYLPIFLDFF